jgi:YHS domain-containing protein
MKKIMGLSLIVSASFFAACGGQSNKKVEVKTVSVTVMDSTNNPETAAKTYAVSLVDNKKDPTCGMPVTAGIGDTAHYDGHVLGFCSAECKSEFLKNPKAGLAAAELKK